MILVIIYLNYLFQYKWFESIFHFFPLFFLFYFLIYFIIKNSKKIIKDKKNNTIYEIKYTFLTFIIFFIITYFYFKLYEKWVINFSFDFSIWSIVFWIFFVILHDAYFYLIHTFLHTKFMMKYVHIVHHKSNPSNIWSSYNFHPIEAIFYAWASIIIFVFPVNFFALLIAIFVNDFLTILWHCWYELFWKNIKNTFFYKYFATTTYHDTHHSHNNWNLWLYFTHFDNIFKTRSKDYEKNLDNITK